MKSKNNHVHLYELVTFAKSGRQVFKCMLPMCTHYLPEIELALGRASLCHHCKETIVLTAEHLSVKKPLCMKCREIRKLRREALVSVGKEVGKEDDDGEE